MSSVWPPRLPNVCRLWSTCSIRSTRLFSTEERWRSAQLTHRTVIRVSGNESATFLQGLITNDINSLVDKETNSLHCMFLNTGGRVLFDSIISPGFEPNEFMVEVDSGLAKTVIKHLNMYKVRRKLQIEALKNLNIYAVYHDKLSVNTSPAHQTQSDVIGSTFCDGGTRGSQLPDFSGQSEAVMCHPDPRVDLLGYRFLSSEGDTPESALSLNVENVSLDDYTEYRFKLGVPEGAQEILPAKALPLEYNMDYLHGVSFHKGCYIGQELTARTHHTGVIRKRILPIQFLEKSGQSQPSLEPDTSILNESGKSVGKLRRVSANYGLALLRLKETFSATELTCNGATLCTWKPAWWPREKSQSAEDGSC
eukprot:TRINITY_DN1791_c0_g1_i4.p1 TRINITY_DN1791_c0_g1~~TRINITY_DN1791_c0_g1_i4.p1  ORF type:complete len:366 (+),score=45.96 TRINITY_DN1791_c0_g1_i4:192-1289(+)